MIDINELISDSMGYRKTTSIEKLEKEIDKLDSDSDIAVKELSESSENISTHFFNNELQQKAISDKINMIKKLKRVYCDGRMKNKTAKHSLESYLDQSMEFVVGAVTAIFGALMKAITTVIKFIIKTIAYIAKSVLHVIASVIAFFTKSKKHQKSDVDGFFSKFFKHSRSTASLDRGLERSMPETNGNDRDYIISLAVQTKEFVKTNEEIKNMSLEEIFFYKVFFINADPANIKYVCESFNRAISQIKELGNRLHNAGNRLLIDTRPTGSSSREDLEEFSTEETRSQELNRLGEMLIKSNIIDIEHNDSKQDFFTLMKSIQKSMNSNIEGTVWLKKFYNIFKNGQDELKKISVDLENKQKALEKIDVKTISDTNRRRIQEYNFEINQFQKFLISYNSCTSYFVKYTKLRADLINKFNNSIDKYIMIKKAA